MYRSKQNVMAAREEKSKKLQEIRDRVEEQSSSQDLEAAEPLDEPAVDPATVEVTTEKDDVEPETPIEYASNVDDRSPDPETAPETEDAHDAEAFPDAEAPPDAEVAPDTVPAPDGEVAPDPEGSK